MSISMDSRIKNAHVYRMDDMKENGDTHWQALPATGPAFYPLGRARAGNHSMSTSSQLVQVRMCTIMARVHTWGRRTYLEHVDLGKHTLALLIIHPIQLSNLHFIPRHLQEAQGQSTQMG